MNKLLHGLMRGVNRWVARYTKATWENGDRRLPTAEETDLAIGNAVLMLCSLEDGIPRERVGRGLAAAAQRLEYLEKFAPAVDDETQGTSNAMEEFWELSYAQYLTIPRSVICSMPVVWQDRFALLLKEMDNCLDWRPEEGSYWCRLRDNRGRLVHDPLMNYRHVGYFPLRTGRKVQEFVTGDAE